MNKYNAIERLSQIFPLLNTTNSDVTITHLSEYLSINKSVIRKDIHTLQKYNFFLDNTLDDDALDEMYDEIDYRKNDIDDDTPLNIDTELFRLNDEYPMYITHREKELLAQYYSDLLKDNKNRLYMIKESATKEHYEQSSDYKKGQDSVKKMQDAIEYAESIIITIDNKDNKKLECYTVVPRAFYHNISNGRMYIMTYDEENDDMIPWRLDQIKKIQYTDKTEKNIPPFPEKYKKMLPYIWGMDYCGATEATHVKLRIKAYNRNILEKIQNDISRRPDTKKFYQDSNDSKYWYYEDDIIGLGAFRTWVHQFGSAMTVLEPISLANEIYDSAVTRAQTYEQLKQLYKK